MHIIKKSAVLITLLTFGYSIFSPQSSAQSNPRKVSPTKISRAPTKLANSNLRFTSSNAEDMLLTVTSVNPTFLRPAKSRNIASDSGTLSAGPVRLSKMCRDQYGVVHYATGQTGERDYEDCVSQQSAASLDQQYFGTSQRQAGAGILFIR